MELHKSTIVSLRNHPVLTERWLQDRIVNDTTILGLGDLVVRSQERSQPKGGRLDLLLEDPDSDTRYEIEIQLGTVDESHIIRTLEYWDLERKRYPQYEHVAVIVAEEITSLEVNGFLTLNSTKVLDIQSLGTEEEDSPSLVTDRAYWEAKASRETLEIVDQLVEIVREIDPRLVARYNKFYIGLGIDGLANNFAAFKPRKKHVSVQIKLPKTEETDELIENANVQSLDYDKRWGRYRVQLTTGDVLKQRSLLLPLLQQAYQLRNG